MAPGRALALEADLLAIFQAGRNTDIEVATIGQGDPPRGAQGRLAEADRDGEVKILAPAGLGAPSSAATEQVREDVFGTEALGGLAAAALVRPGEVEVPRAACAAALPEGRALETLRVVAGIAVGIDFAAVELRTLFLVAQDVVGAADFLKLLLRGFVTTFGIRVVLLGECPERFFDFGLARGFRHAEYGIGIAHTFSCPPLLSRGVATNIGSGTAQR